VELVLLREFRRHIGENFGVEIPGRRVGQIANAVAGGHSGLDRGQLAPRLAGVVAVGEDLDGGELFCFRLSAFE